MAFNSVKAIVLIVLALVLGSFSELSFGEVENWSLDNHEDNEVISTKGFGLSKLPLHKKGPSTPTPIKRPSPSPPAQSSPPPSPPAKSPPPPSPPRKSPPPPPAQSPPPPSSPPPKSPPPPPSPPPKSPPPPAQSPPPPPSTPPKSPPPPVQSPPPPLTKQPPPPPLAQSPRQITPPPSPTAQPPANQRAPPPPLPPPLSPPVSQQPKLLPPPLSPPATQPPIRRPPPPSPPPPTDYDEPPVVEPSPPMDQQPIIIPFPPTVGPPRITPPGIHPPGKPLIVVGRVNCKSCSSRGLPTLFKASPLHGASVKLVCHNNGKKANVQSALTDKNGDFAIIPVSLTGSDVHRCRVYIVKSPKHICNVPTNYNNGKSGALLRSNPPANPGPGPMQQPMFDFFGVGPFIFEAPSKFPCKK